MGMKKVFALTDDSFWVALGISFGVPLALFAIILIVKARENPHIVVSAFLLYVLFDGLVALPFNFLFFYDHLTKCERIEKAEENFETIILDCDSLIIPQREYFYARYNNLMDTTIIYENYNRKRQNSEKDYLENKASAKKNRRDGSYDSTQYSTKISDNNKIYDDETTSHKKERDSIISENGNQAILVHDSLNSYDNLKNKLIECVKKQHELANASDLGSKIPKVDSIRTLLSEICNGSNFAQLKAHTKSLKAEKQSSIMSVRQFYKWLIEKIKGENDTEISEDQRWNTVMSFSVSVVIDILPLLLSLLFIMYTRND
jgi:hypothetical protein